MLQCLGRRARLRHALRDMVAGHRAVAADVVGPVLGHGLEHRLADLHGHRVGRCLHAVGAGVARTALHGGELQLHRLADELEHLLGLLADVLHPAVAGDVVADLAQSGLEVGLQQAVLVARDEIFEGVEHGRLDELRIGVAREHQRQFLLEHQRAARHRGDDGPAFAGISRQHGHVGLPGLFHRLQIAEFELGHATALLLLDDLVRDLVVVEQLHQVGADAGLVVVHVAGGEDGHLAGRAFAVDGRERGVVHGAAPAETLRRHARHPGLGVHTELAVHELAREAGGVDLVDDVHHDGDAGELAVHVGAGEQLLLRAHFALLELDGLGAQHQVREVQVPGVRRRVRALGHVAQVAQVALVDHAPVVGLLDAVHFTVGGGVDQVEQVGETLAQADAAAAAVADVEHALHLGEGLPFVVEVGVLPVDRVPGGGFEVAFAHGGLPVGGSNGTRGTRPPVPALPGAGEPAAGACGGLQSTSASSAFW